MISVIVPTLNEFENIEPLLDRILQCQPAPDEIVFVDDGSTDGTRERIRSFVASIPVRLIERAAPVFGLSGAVIAGARAARGDLLVVMDADLSHPPEKVSELVRPILEGTADMVIGSRYVPGASTPGWPVWRRIMSRIAAGLAYPLTGVHDSMCGFFAIRKTDLLEFTPAATGFKIAFEAIVHGGKQLRVLEVPILFRDRARGTSKMNPGVALRFALRWLAAASRMRFRRGSRVRPQGTAVSKPPSGGDLEVALPCPRPTDRNA
ncbi:MAG TPA: polyprenol monophosphomannose synthase [Chthoniobacterales bacterium]|nr:polyprenol monophosphomannose synthase [Chthoniobacterales bacterium]